MFLRQPRKILPRRFMDATKRCVRTVLVVDDEESIRDTMRIHLESEGFGVVTSENGKDAIDALKRHDVSIVVTDIKMPVLDGFALLDHVRERYSFLPVIMLTGYVDVNMAVDAMRRGSSDYVTKPVRKKELIAAVENVLRRTECEKDSEHFRISRVSVLLDGGILIFHKDLSKSPQIDADVFGGMLATVRMFINDTFLKHGNEVKSLMHGSSRILIEEGDGFFLVVVGEGKDTAFVRSAMRRCIKRMERRYGDAASAKPGKSDDHKEIEAELVDLLETQDPSREGAHPPDREPPRESGPHPEDQAGDGET